MPASIQKSSNPFIYVKAYFNSTVIFKIVCGINFAKISRSTHSKVMLLLVEVNIATVDSGISKSSKNKSK